MSSKILIVDDDRNICEILEFNFGNEGFYAECAYSAEDALTKPLDDFAVIILDVMMGGMSGYAMAKKLRAEGNRIPIIFLTAKDTEDDLLAGFSSGGDDYISKPFSIKEVIARVKAVVKRTEQSPKPDISNRKLVFEKIVIDAESKELTIEGKKIALTKTEFEILILLAENPEKTYSRENIIDRVWKETTFVIERTVDVHITRLRKKMGKHASIIVNRPGYGYKFNNDLQL